MGRPIRPLVQSAVAGLVVLGSLFVATAPAQAFSPNPSAYWMTQIADQCTDSDTLHVRSGSEFILSYQSLACRITTATQHFDSAYDAGGENVAVELWSGSKREGVVYFGAYGEHLKVFDLDTTDGDTFYVWIAGQGPFCNCGGSDGNVDLNLADGGVFNFKITDDQAGTDTIANSPGSLPYIRA